MKGKGGWDSFIRFLTKIYGFFVYGIRFRMTAEPMKEKIQGPAIIVSNHTSLIDWYYASRLFYRERIVFIIARTFYYNRITRFFFEKTGNIPKSVFTRDYESAKASLRVIKDGGILALFPEGRLTVSGRTQTFDPSTPGFLKKCGVPVYGMHIQGGYLAKPKWAGKRKHPPVHVSSVLLFSADDLKRLGVNEIAEKLENYMKNDDFKWLAEHPEINYPDRDLAKGLENILITCPKCGSDFTLESKGTEIRCTKCGFEATLEPRYRFVSQYSCPHNFAESYDKQLILLKSLINDESFQMKSHVTLYVPSNGIFTAVKKAGEGTCVLNRYGLTYTGTNDGKTDILSFPLESMYCLTYASGKKFEIYSGKDYYRFVPDDKRQCIKWHLCSYLLNVRYNGRE